MTAVNFFVPGAPQGKGRARAFTKPGGGIGHYTPEKTRTYEGMIRSLAMDAMGSQLPIEGPVEMSLVIVMPIPKSWPNWKRELALQGKVMPTTKPDQDNCIKAAKDGMNGVVWVDDCQVVSTISAKVYAGGEFLKPGLYISAQQMTAMGAQHKHKPGVAP